MDGRHYKNPPPIPYVSQDKIGQSYTGPRDVHGAPIHKGAKVRSATTPDKRVYVARDVGYDGSRHEGKIRIAVQHWERAVKWELVPSEKAI